MEKMHLTIAVGRESSDEEMKAVANAFSQEFDVEVKNDYSRKSAELLPMIVDLLINIGGSAIYDLLKAGVKRLLSDDTIKRRMSVTIRRESELYVLTKEKIYRQKTLDRLEFESVDSLFEFMKNSTLKATEKGGTEK